MIENMMKTIASLSLATLIILVEGNLLRIFLLDWWEARREASEKSLAFTRRRMRKSGNNVADASHRRWIIATVLCGSLLVPCAARAQQLDASARDTSEPALPETEATKVQQPEGKSAISLQLNFDYTTGYFYRGIVQEDCGLILQPAARLTVNLWEDGDFKLDAIMGTWNSFQGQKTAARTDGDFTEYWYESDLYGGVVITKGKLSLTTTYTFLTSPSDAYQTVQELGFTLAFDDSEWLGAFALKPYAIVVIETGADASDGADSDTGKYLELGIGPGFSFDCGKTPVTVTFPVSVGLSLDDYYQDSNGNDDTFGFAQVGIKASLPLPIGQRYGAWTLNAGVAGLFLGDHTQDYNDGDGTEVIVTVGVQVNF